MQDGIVGEGASPPSLNSLLTTVAVIQWDDVNQVGHLSKTHLNLLEMYEISFGDAAMSRA